MSLTRSIAKVISDYDNPRSIGYRLRARRIRPLLSMVEEIYEEKECVNILDIGGTKTYWKILPVRFLDEKNINITILNIPGSIRQHNEGKFTFIEGDGCNLAEYKNNSFDIVHSNSVIEHVGDWSRMVQFAKEVSRLARNYYIQTPYYWFPVEPHCMTPFFHWLPKPLRISLVMKFKLGHWGKHQSVDTAVRTVESARLLDKKMFRELFKDAEMTTEKILFISKSLIAIRHVQDPYG